MSNYLEEVVEGSGCPLTGNETKDKKSRAEQRNYPDKNKVKKQ